MIFGNLFQEFLGECARTSLPPCDIWLYLVEFQGKLRMHLSRHVIFGILFQEFQGNLHVHLSRHVMFGILFQEFQEGRVHIPPAI